MVALVIGVFAIVGIILAVSGKARVLLKGFINIFIEDRAKTPEGARAVFNEAIEEQQDRYNKSSDQLQLAAGQLKTAQDALKDAQKRLIELDGKCQRLAAANKFNEVEVLAEEMPNLQAEVEEYETTVVELTKIYNEAQEIFEHNQKALEDIKKEAKRVVESLKRDEMTKEMYDAMDELKRNSNVDKLLGSVRDGAKEKKEVAVGARAVHENKTTTKVARAESVAKQVGSNDYVAQLKAKYGKSSTSDAFEVKEHVKNKN